MVDEHLKHLHSLLCKGGETVLVHLYVGGSYCSSADTMHLTMPFTNCTSAAIGVVQCWYLVPTRLGIDSPSITEHTVRIWGHFHGTS